MPALVADVRRNKALATVLERPTVTDASGNAVDLSALATAGGPAPSSTTPRTPSGASTDSSRPTACAQTGFTP